LGVNAPAMGGDSLDEDDVIFAIIMIVFFGVGVVISILLTALLNLNDGTYSSDFHDKGVTVEVTVDGRDTCVVWTTSEGNWTVALVDLREQPEIKLLVKSTTDSVDEKVGCTNWNRQRNLAIVVWNDSAEERFRLRDMDFEA